MRVRKDSLRIFRLRDQPIPEEIIHEVVECLTVLFSQRFAIGSRTEPSQAGLYFRLRHVIEFVVTFHSLSCVL